MKHLHSKRTGWLLLLSAMASCASLPRPGKPAMPDIQFRMRDFRLANGMRVIVEEDHASPNVGVFTVVGVGSSGDPSGRAGLAHFIEHLAFRARPGGRGTAWNQLEEAGVGFLNAMTGFDQTVYMEVGSKELLPQLLAIEAGRVLNPLGGVDQKVFEVEREVVRNELRQTGEENSIGPAFNFMQEALFPPGHPYAQPIGGTHQSLSAISFDDAKQFVAAHYRPANMTMVIIGDVDLATVEQSLSRGLPGPAFAPLRPTQAAFPARLVAKSTEPPAPPPQRLITRQATVASPELYVVWSLPRSFGEETVLLDFVSDAANAELSGAAFSDPDIVDVQVFSEGGVEASMLIARVALHTGAHPEDSMERVLDQLVKLWSTGGAGRGYEIDAALEAVEADREFIRMRNSAVMAMTLGGENIMNRGTERAISAHFTGDPLTYSRQLRALASVTPSQVSRYAETYLQRSRARAVLVTPFPPGSRESVAKAVGLSPAVADPLTKPLPPEAVQQLGKAHDSRRPYETVVSAKREHIEEALPNGLKVVVHRRRDSLPLAVVQLTFTTGTAGTTPKGAGELAGILGRPSKHLYGFGGEFGISWRTQVEVDRSTFTASGANGNVPNMLAQLSERVKSMSVHDHTLAYLKNEMAEYLEKQEQLPPFRADRDLDAALFKGHALGQSATVAEQLSLSAGDVESWIQRAFSPANAVLVVTGDIDAEATLALVKTWLGSWEPPRDSFPQLAPPTLRNEPLRVQVTHQANATQAQLHLACLANGKELQQVLAQQTLASVLGTALFEKIRGELGASYGFGGSASQLVGGVGRLDWYGSIEDAMLAKGLGVIRSSLKRFEEETLTDRAIERGRWAVARQATQLNATLGRLANNLTRQLLMGRKPEELGTLFESLSAVGRKPLLETWSQCQGSMVLSAVGDEGRIRAALKEAGF